MHSTRIFNPECRVPRQEVSRCVDNFSMAVVAALFQVVNAAYSEQKEAANLDALNMQAIASISAAATFGSLLEAQRKLKQCPQNSGFDPGSSVTLRDGSTKLISQCERGDELLTATPGCYSRVHRLHRFGRSLNEPVVLIESGTGMRPLRVAEKTPVRTTTVKRITKEDSLGMAVTVGYEEVVHFKSADSISEKRARHGGFLYQLEMEGEEGNQSHIIVVDQMPCGTKRAHATIEEEEVESRTAISFAAQQRKSFGRRPSTTSAMTINVLNRKFAGLGQLPSPGSPVATAS